MQDEIRSVGIVSKPGVPQAEMLLPGLRRWLKERGVTVQMDEATAGYLQCEGLPRESAVAGVQLVIVLGGDGTLLSAARALQGGDVPIFPVNLGGLGFLTAITVDEIYPQLERAFLGEHRIGRRRLLQCELHRDGEIVGLWEALNDAVLTKQSLARIIDLDVFVDSHHVSPYKADGLIVSTPTGSTAYSLSAGGPIIFPSVGALCITPICPHVLTHRPVLVPETSIIRIVCRSADDAYLTIDGQVGMPVSRGDIVMCRSSANSISLIRPPQMLFFDVLREKLKWGQR